MSDSEDYRTRLPDLDGLDLRALRDLAVLGETDQQALGAALERLRSRDAGAPESLLHQDEG
jgi:hypothetical protein